ncbi:MAG: Asp-tRNA(Asn)/Glu-tRNA(Gln) amidotransferase subunit GatC, partial [Clostridiales bacterium]|nr:Asp-tRNA(Asn)/Glu-tRNA(Gln) amidotransferase subunit GatC [Clostridiales bacterium]
KDASCPMTQAPSTVDADQLVPLGICLTESVAMAEEEHAKPEAKRERVVKLDLEKLEGQAKLSLTKAEGEQTKAQLYELIDFANALHAINTEGVPPMFSPSDARNIHLTERDEPRFTVDDALQNAPEKRDGFFFVPPVVE